MLQRGAIYGSLTPPPRHVVPATHLSHPLEPPSSTWSPFVLVRLVLYSYHCIKCLAQSLLLVNRSSLVLLSSL